MMKFCLPIISIIFALYLCEVNGHGCIPMVCDGNTNNDFKTCADSDPKCGQYESERWGKRIVLGVDLKCDTDSKVFAPFNGTVFYYTPFGDGSCLDAGVKLEGSGEWQGYFATIAYMKPYKTSGEVHQGQLIGRAVNVRECNTKVKQASNHVLFQLYKQGRVIDPTSHLQSCMCTGALCQSNKQNAMMGAPYKENEKFGMGFEFECGDVSEDEATDGDRTPVIYSPIEGERIGRMRLRDPTKSPGDCTNDGVFISGKKGGKWEDFVVRVYNAKFMDTPGERDIKQGEAIARRLNCDGEENKSIFVEFRHRGRLVNITEQILGVNCKLPEL